MPDIYATIAEASPEIVEGLANVLETRAASAAQREMLKAYLTKVEFSGQARVLEIGCGTGPVSRALAKWPGVGEVVGLDPSPVFLKKARELSAGHPELTFEEGDGRALPFENATFDVAVFHTVLCHVPGPEQALAEAVRAVKPGGQVAVFDGDYATTTLAVGEFDPLQACADAAIAALVHDRWLVRRLPAMLRAQGLEVTSTGSHGFVETTEEGYMLSIAERGAEALAREGRITPDHAEALKQEARRRIKSGEFFGHIAYSSLAARKPA
jgi:ubiquinone/menaquinone biosynthesis C-methylase UbiE